MYYLEKGLGQKWLGVLFAVFAAVASFGIGNMVQANSVAEPVEATFGIPKLLTGLVIGGLVFAVIIGDDEKARKTVGNVKEVEARDAPVVAITDGQTDVHRYADHVLEIPETHERAAAVLANAHLQLLSYHTAAKLGRNIDKPRNLAKSVTVE